MITGGKINASIDLRSSWPQVRDQGVRQTCLACAASDAHSYFQNSAALSAEYLFFHAVQRSTAKDPTRGLTFDEASAALEKDGQPLEKEWPYSLTHPTSWAPPAVTNRWYARLQVETKMPAQVISNWLKDGSPVLLGIKLSGAFLGVAASDYVIPATGAGYGGHAVLAIGLGHRSSRDQYFLIRNSWGTTWGNNGCAWLEIKYLDDKLIGYSRVTKP